MASLIDRYVSDLFNYALENDQLESYHKYALLYIRGSDPDSAGGIPDELDAFLAMLPPEDANAVIHKFFEAARERLGRLDVKIFSALPLKPPQINEIKRKLAAKYDKKTDEIDFVPKIDRSLIGGIRIVVDNEIFDNSVKTMLTEMKKNVYKEVYLK